MICAYPVLQRQGRGSQNVMSHMGTGPMGCMDMSGCLLSLAWSLRVEVGTRHSRKTQLVGSQKMKRKAEEIMCLHA